MAIQKQLHQFSCFLVYHLWDKQVPLKPKVFFSSMDLGTVFIKPFLLGLTRRDASYVASEATKIQNFHEMIFILILSSHLLILYIFSCSSPFHLHWSFSAFRLVMFWVGQVFEEGHPVYCRVLSTLGGVAHLMPVVLSPPPS